MEMASNREVDLAAKWAESRQLVATGNRDGDLSEWTLVDSLELEVLTGEIRTRGDVVAKLKAIHLAFQDGPRCDGADAVALRQTIAWLESVALRQSSPLTAHRSAA